jgi:hypothetical protein
MTQSYRPFRTRSALAALALLLAALACNMPTRGGEQQPTQLPAPNQTLTALFAITPVDVPGTATPTLPPVATATSPETGGGVAPSPVPPTATVAQAAATAIPTVVVNTVPAPTAAVPTAVVPTAVVPTVAITPLNPTARPTNAPTAGPTATTATRRTVFEAAFLATPPTLDGDWSEWKDISREYPANHVTYGAGARTNDDDLSASFHIGWDNDNLYLAVKVRDDVYVQNAAGENLFKGDSLELLLDTKLQEDIFYGQLSADDFQLGISPGRPDPNGTREAYLWFPANIAGGRSSVKIGSRLESGVYRVEAAIPWTVLETTPAANKRFGFVLSVSDNDNPAENVQQSLVSSTPNRRLTDPTTWGELVLLK